MMNLNWPSNIRKNQVIAQKISLAVMAYADNTAYIAKLKKKLEDINIGIICIGFLWIFLLTIRVSNIKGNIIIFDNYNFAKDL